MRLYHYTTIPNALLIGVGHDGGGLTTGGHDDGTETGSKAEYVFFKGVQTMGQPVVWLTKEENGLSTDDGRPVRCIVEVERSRHLMRWAEFLRTTKIEMVAPDGKRITGRDLLRTASENPAMTPAVMTGWWVSLKPIKARDVIVSMTPAQAVAGCDWQIEKHPTAEGRAEFKTLRDRFAAEAPDALILFHEGKCAVIDPAAQAKAA